MSNPYNSATDRASVLGPTLYFKGDLSAEEDLLIQGRVEGTITHTQRLTVGPQGTVKGNIFAPTVSILEGAAFSGRIDMDGKKAGQGATKDSAQGRPIRPATSAA
jgi:cytoskeletal protein CcmA (bactofilin family)